LLGYLWVFMIIVAITASVLHFFLTKRLLKPIRSLMASTEQLKRGHYPEPIEVYKNDEIGQLVSQYNGLIKQLQMNEQQRKTLVSDLSHEIRTPLSNLDGYLQALKDGTIAGDEALFTSLHQESNRLSQMVAQLEQLKEWDHLSAQSFANQKTTDISEVLEQCASMFQWTLNQKNIAIQVHAAPCILPFHVEGIQQAISNLLDNAIIYYEGIGPIVLTGEVQGSHYKISVSGPGKPILGAEQENVFKRFYRLDSSRSRATGGSGLGLAITKKIVEHHHHGEIGIETTFDSNTFWIVLPRVE
ncbi:MAG TPA: ATP-binding protein, partial [Lentibacillus sp.]|uniref:sensor histidine kinase n=1 Tax=Lentibacillus sp. TaxID=1925746 RepID=UPI002B4AF835